MANNNHPHGLPVPWRYLVPVSSIGIIYGYDMGASATVSHLLPQDLDLTQSEFASINSVIGIGLLLGAVIGGFMSNRLGRQKTLLVVAVIFTLFSLGAACANGLLVLDGCRLVLGIGIGLSTVAAPIFVGELAPDNRRGGLIAMYQVSNACGIILAYVVGYVLAPFESWRLIFALAAIPSLFVALMLLRLPDTPNWYLMRGLRRQACSVFESLGLSADQAALECDRIEHRLDTRRQQRTPFRVALKALLTPPYRRAFGFVLGFGALAKLTGINALVYYQPLIFDNMGFKGTLGQLLIPGLITFFSVLTTLLALVLVDRVGRKPLLTAGLGLMLLGDLIIAAIFLVSINSPVGLAFGLIGFACFQAGFGLSFGSLIWVYSAESLPGHLRAVGATVALSGDFMINILIAQFFPSLFSSLGGSGAFLGFAAMALLAIVFCVRFAPETKGRPLEDIRLFWENGGRW